MYSTPAASTTFSAPGSDTQISATKRLWPVLLFGGLCFAAYFYSDWIIRHTPSSHTVQIVVGFGLGTLAVAFLLAGCIGSSRAGSASVATLLTIAFFGVAIAAHYDELFRRKFEIELLIYQAHNLLYIPLLILCSTVPLTPVLKFFRNQLVRGSSQPKSQVTLETYFLWTVIVACAVFCAQLSIQMNHYSWRQLLLFLPGQIVFVIVVSAVLVLPTAYWPFLESKRWWNWPATTFIALTSFFVVGTVANLTIRQWLGARIPEGTSMLTFSLVACAVYLPGMWSLRACGYRWKPIIETSDDDAICRVALQDRFSARLATMCYLILAILASLTQHYADYLKQLKLDSILAIRKEFLDRGDAIKAAQNQICGLQLNSLHRDRFSEALLDRLSDHYELVLKKSNIVDDDLQLLSLAPTFYSLDLSHTAVTDKALPHLDSLKKLMYLKISGTNITPTALGEFLDTHRSIESLSLEDMQLTDDQFKTIYKPWIKEWRLAGNNLTDEGVNTMMSNDTVRIVDLSRNPISRNAFSVTTRLSRISIQADNCPLDDVIVAKLVKAGLLGELILGKSSVTPAGLTYALDMGVSVTLMPGSFTDPELESIDPKSGDLEIAGMKTSGSFLKYWKQSPRSLRTSDTLLNDEALLNWSEERRSEPIKSLGLRGSKVTDACIPAINVLRPKQLDVRATQITAAGLKKLSLADTLLIVDYGQFSNDEIRSLQKQFSAVGLGCDDY